jgi:hypothetical protein
MVVVPSPPPVGVKAAIAVVAALRAAFLVLAVADAASRLALDSAVRSAPFFNSVVGRSCHNMKWSNCRLRAAEPYAISTKDIMIAWADESARSCSRRVDHCTRRVQKVSKMKFAG